MAGKFSITFLASSSEANCAIICAGEDKLLVDCGLTTKTFFKMMERTSIDFNHIRGVLVSHYHSDHLSRTDPLYRRLHLPVYTHAETVRCYPALEQADQILFIEHLEPFKVENIEILPVETPHCPGSMGFVLTYEGRRCAVFTDLGHTTEAMQEACQGVHVLAIESNYSPGMLATCGKYVDALKERIGSEDGGHLSNAQVRDFLKATYCSPALNLHTVVLTHLSVRTNLPCLAKAFAEDGLKDANKGGMNTNVIVAEPHAVSGPVEI